eukprot:219567_1
MGAAVSFGISKSSETRLPPLDGILSLPILDKPGSIKYDKWGCPHIYASTRKDGFRLQGFVTAQHRLFQLVQSRLAIHGQLSSVIGEPGKAIDVFSRTCNFKGLGEGDWEHLIKHKNKYQSTIDMVSCYTEGINAWLTHPQFQPSVELSYLMLNHDPILWKQSDVMSMGRLIGIKMSLGWNSKILSTLLIQLVGYDNAEWFSFDTEKVYECPYQDTPNKVADFYLQLQDIGKLLEKKNQPILGLKRSYFRSKEKYCSPFDPDNIPDEKVEQEEEDANDTTVVMDLEQGAASNAFVVGGAHTANGMPLLCNDPHLILNVPNPMFYCHVTVESEENKEDNLQFTGVQAVGLPGMCIGHTDTVAIGLTLGVCDTTDIFVERFEDEKSNKYEVDGEWKECDVRQEIINIKGAEDHVLNVRETHHGPILDPTEYDQGLVEKGPYSHKCQNDDEKCHLRYSLCATFLKDREEIVCTPLESTSSVLDCKNMIEAAGHLRKTSWPNLNFMLADTTGNYGWTTNGMVPIREGMDDYDPMLPQPGWISKYDWKRYIPDEELPRSINPKCGYVVSCNNNMVDDEKYPYYLGFSFAMGFRAKRASQLIDQELVGPNKITMGYLQSVQCDVHDLSSENLMRVMNTLDVDEMIANHNIDLPEWVVFTSRCIIPKEIRKGVEVGVDYYNATVNRDKAAYAWKVLSEWDNEYTVDTLGAPIYDAFMVVLLRRLMMTGVYRSYAQREKGEDVMDEEILKRAEKMSMNITRNVYNRAFVGVTSWFYKKTGPVLTMLSCETANEDCWWIRNYGNRENLLIMSLIDTVDCIQFWSKTEDKSKWTWGTLHEVEIFHPASAKLGPEPFNSKVYPLRGGHHTLNMCRPNYEGIVENPLKAIRSSLPTWRQLIDCSDWSKSKCLLPMGISGQVASPYYQNQLKMFVDCEYIPMLWNEEDVEQHKSSELKCDPLRDIAGDEASYCAIL